VVTSRKKVEYDTYNYQSSLYIRYAKFSKERLFRCFSIDNACIQSQAKIARADDNSRTTIVNVKENSGKLIIIKIKLEHCIKILSLPDRPDVRRPKQRSCRNIFYIRRTSKTSFEWECRSTSDYLVDMATSEYPCIDPITCYNYFENSEYVRVFYLFAK